MYKYISEGFWIAITAVAIGHAAFVSMLLERYDDLNEKLLNELSACAGINKVVEQKELEEWL